MSAPKPAWSGATARAARTGLRNGQDGAPGVTHHALRDAADHRAAEAGAAVGTDDHEVGAERVGRSTDLGGRGTGREVGPHPRRRTQAPLENPGEPLELGASIIDPCAVVVDPDRRRRRRKHQGLDDMDEVDVERAPLR